MALAPLTLLSPGKINLSLKILGRRPDGFHALESLFCPITLADAVTLTPLKDGDSRITCSQPGIPSDESNLAMKALRAFASEYPLPHSYWIHLMKRIPHGAGMGGGSSNAATVLLGLNQLHGHPLSLESLAHLATQLGSDVPFFLYQSPCFVTGRGEHVTPRPDFQTKLPLVLVKPPFEISAAWAYQHLKDSQELKGVLYAPQLCPWGSMVNDLERPVFEKWLLLPTLKNWLLDQPETHAALMSGSGSTLFAVTHHLREASILAERVRDHYGPSYWVTVSETRVAAV